MNRHRPDLRKHPNRDGCDGTDPLSPLCARMCANLLTRHNRHPSLGRAVVRAAIISPSGGNAARARARLWCVLAGHCAGAGLIARRGRFRHGSAHRRAPVIGREVVLIASLSESGSGLSDRACDQGAWSCSESACFPLRSNVFRAAGVRTTRHPSVGRSEPALPRSEGVSL